MFKLYHKNSAENININVFFGVLKSYMNCRIQFILFSTIHQKRRQRGSPLLYNYHVLQYDLDKRVLKKHSKSVKFSKKYEDTIKLGSVVFQNTRSK